MIRFCAAYRRRQVRFCAAFRRRGGAGAPAARPGSCGEAVLYNRCRAFVGRGNGSIFTKKKQGGCA